MGSEDVEISIHPESFVPSGRSSQIQHLSAATGLILTYLIEIGVQIFLTIEFWHSVITLPVGIEWLWTVVLSLVISSLIVSSVSLIWVCRSLDFAGRLCGRLLCYVMHVLLLGIPWRYLKLAFAYDPTDVQEFIALRIFQTYVQSLPLSSIHLAALLTFHQNWTCVGMWLVGVESVSIVIALIIASYCSPLPAQPQCSTPSIFGAKNFKSKTTRCFQENLKCSTTSTSTVDESVLWCRVLKIELNILSRALLLFCRIVTMGLLLSMLKYWAVVFIIFHFVIALIWIHLPTKNEYWTLSRSLECSYVIFWDITSTLCGELKLATWAGPVTLALVENGLTLTWAHWNFAQMGWIVTTSYIGLVVGFLLFVLLNLSRLTPWRTLFGTRVQKINVPFSITQSSPKEQKKEIRSELKQKGNLQFSGNKFINIKKNLGGGKPRREDIFEETNNCKDHLKETKVTHYTAKVCNIDTVNVTHPRMGLGYTETFVPDSCCNDSNGSSNSRNTNTLIEPTLLEVEEDILEETIKSNDFVFCFPSGVQENIPKGSSPTFLKNVPEIKTASRVIMNIPKHTNEKRSRCPCHCQNKKLIPQLEQNLIEKGSYGILFCEDGSPGTTKDKNRCQNSTLPALRHNRLRVLCAKCLQNHDPLLTDCHDDNEKSKLEDVVIGNSRSRIPSIMLPSETTDYPSETEMTWTGVDEEAESEVTSLHSSPSTPGHWTQPPMWSAMLTQSSKQFTSKEYVRTWLLSSQTLQRHRRHQQKLVQNGAKFRSLPYPTHHHTVISYRPLDFRDPKTEVNRFQHRLYYKDLEIIV